jgi:CRP/FNR family cyclic AMP-dependent transcriptional regulator
METVETIDQILARQPFFADFAPDYARLVAGCARLCQFQAGEYLFREGQAADNFFLIRHGRVALEIAMPGRPPVVVATASDSDVLGAAWLVAPYRTMFDARALEFTRAISFDAKCLRDKCEADHSLGYEMMKRFLPVFVKRLHATRMQILDVYGNG